MTLDDWMRGEVPSEKGRAIFTSACQSIWGADPKELSLLYVLQYSAAAGNAENPGSFLRLITTGGGAQESRFVGGSQVISEKVADRLGKRVVLKAPVSVVAQNGDGVRIVARRHDGRGAPRRSSPCRRRSRRAWPTRPRCPRARRSSSRRSCRAA